jgi:hypothetical protein
MVLTKENAFFVYVALSGILAVNRWTKIGTVTPRLALVMILGPLCGLVFLILLAGGTSQFIEIYRLLVTKAQHLEYAIQTGDGPWSRYLIDLMVLSPIVLCLAIGGVFTSLRKDSGLLYLTAFMFFSYAVMCNVRYGMNLRYATIWDFSLSALAVAQLTLVSRSFGPRSSLAMVVLIAAVCAHQLQQYVVFFRDAGLYELVTEGLLRAVNILK